MFLVLVLKKLIYSVKSAVTGAVWVYKRSSLPKLVMTPVLNPEGWLGFKHMQARNTSIIDQERGMYKRLKAKEDTAHI